MGDRQGCYKTGDAEGIRGQSFEVLGSGNCHAGYAKTGSASKSHSMSLDKQFKSLLRDNDVNIRGDNHQ